MWLASYSASLFSVIPAWPAPQGMAGLFFTLYPIVPKPVLAVQAVFSNVGPRCCCPHHCLLAASDNGDTPQFAVRLICYCSFGEANCHVSTSLSNSESGISLMI